MRYESPFTIYEPSAPGFVTGLTKKSMTGIGLGLSDVVMDHTATITKRQNSLTSSFYHYSTGSSSTSLHTTSSSSKARSKESGGGGYTLESQPGSVVRRSTAESNISGGEDMTATATTTTFVGVRGWWRRHRSRPQTPVTARV